MKDENLGDSTRGEFLGLSFTMDENRRFGTELSERLRDLGDFLSEDGSGDEGVGDVGGFEPLELSRPELVSRVTDDSNDDSRESPSEVPNSLGRI